MVNVKDLMCGNWIYLSDPEDRENTRDIHYIDKVCRDYIRVEDFGDFFEDIYIEPIPVTREFLEKIGFKKDTTAGEPWEFWRYWDKDGKYKLDVYPEELYCNSNRKFGLHVDNASCDSIGSGEFTYVHELQNLTRIITGFSLPITKDMFEDV